MRVLQISADRSKRGILAPGSAAYKRQQAYAAQFGELDIIGFSLRSDGFAPHEEHTLRTIPTRSWSKLFFGLDTLRIVRILQRPAVVSAQDPFETGLLALFIAQMMRAPLHIQVHTDFLSSEYARHSLLNRVRTWIAGFVLRRAARIRVVSDRIKISLAYTYKGLPQISVLPIFVDLALVRGAADPAIAGRFAHFKTRVLVVSRLEPEKNVALAIQAFAAASPSNACLVVVGGGSERAKLELMARTTPARERIFFEGEQSAAPYYAFADLLFVTSKYEGYGLVIVEALSCGVPVLSTDVGAAREVGAIIAPAEEFDSALNDWFRTGTRAGHLIGYPYANAGEYISAYCADIIACTKLN